jgi:dipeptidyl aminopeptidase/acylaminoacyl peptidase
MILNIMVIMKHILTVLFLLLFFFGNLLGQKPPLDTSALANWPKIDYKRISNDGTYVFYTVSSNRAGTALIIWSTENNFKREVHHIKAPWVVGFTEDSRRIIYVNDGDSLCINELGSNKDLYFPKVSSYKIQPAQNGKWLAYRLSTKELVLYDLFSGEQKIYPFVDDYSFSIRGKILLYQTTSSNGAGTETGLHWVDLAAGKDTKIWSGGQIINFAVDQQEAQLAVLTNDGKSAQSTNQIWHYRPGMESCRIWVTQQTPGMEDGFAIANDQIKFSPDGKKLFFSMQKVLPTYKLDPSAVNVDIWNYKDEYLQSDQLKQPPWVNNRSLLAVINERNNKIVKLEHENDGLWGNVELNEGDGDNYFLTETRVNISEGYRKKGERPDIYLVNTNNGTRICIQKQLLDGHPDFSPSGKYVCWYDLQKRAFYTYNINNGAIKNISNKVPFPLWDELWDKPSAPAPYTGPEDRPVWLQNDEAVLICDRYDIWQLDPDGIKQPINITNGYGRKNKTILRYVYFDQSNLATGPIVRNSEKLLLCGFNEITKFNGFFQKTLGTSENPEKLILAPVLFYLPQYLSGLEALKFVLKAKNAEAYLLTRMSATEYPNLQFTRNFDTFKQVSNLQPQNEYNWLTDQLIRWNTFDGHQGEGILYKPENFDPSKKYPIIFYFYERLSGGLNRFIEPELSVGPINIPWFVSRGYLVFCPDIHYTVENPGKGIYDYVVSAAKMLSTELWVDKKRMAIQGHSWGGYEVNYLVTKTNVFAAAASASGTSDLVSHYGETALSGLSNPEFTEQESYRMLATIWQNPASYIQNSPVFGVDKVATPILIMHNKGDTNVPWEQGVEFFSDLRRLGKPSWMLQYDDQGHVVYDNSSLDYTIRLEQFFDHYLKGMPEPKWMSRGIPATLKGIDRGLEIPSGNESGK